jgi:hypothetical protein
VSSVGNTKNVPDGDIPRLIQSINILGVNVPEIAAIETCTIDFEQLDKHSRVSKVEFLQQGQ